LVLFVECVFSKGFYIALGEVFYDNWGFLLVQYSVEASPLLITLTRKTLSSWFLEDRLSVFSIFSVLELKFAASAESQVSATLSVFKNLGRRFPAKTFSRTIVNKIDNIIYSLLRNCTKIETFRKEET